MPKKGMTAEKLLAQENWHEERKALREILLDCGLEEAIKWGQFCYMAQGGNIAIIFAMKETVGVSFFKGALLNDPQGRLTDNGPNSVAVMRVAFTSLDQIRRDEAALRAFVAQAVENERKGLKVERGENQMPDWPEELEAALEGDDALREAFENLTPGRQRGYLIHFTGAKSSAARARRIAKYHDQILAGKGQNDR